MWTEAAIARELEGRFFNIEGQDVNEIRRDREREREQTRMDAIQRRAYRRAQAMAIIARKKQVMGRTGSDAFVLAVAAAHGIGVEELTSRNRAIHISHARQHACALMRAHTEMSFPQIGRAVGGIDHTSVQHAVKVWNGFRRLDYPRQHAAALEMLGISESETSEYAQPNSATTAVSGDTADLCTT